MTVPSAVLEPLQHQVDTVLNLEQLVSRLSADMDAIKQWPQDIINRGLKQHQQQLLCSLEAAHGQYTSTTEPHGAPLRRLVAARECPYSVAEMHKQQRIRLDDARSEATGQLSSFEDLRSHHANLMGVAQTTPQ